MKELFLTALAVCCGLAGLATAAGVHYKFSPAGNYPGAFETIPLAANLTQIVGFYEAAIGGGAYIQTFRTTTGAIPRFLNIAPPGSGGSYASGINAHGVVAGGYCSGCTYPQSQHGFTWDHGIFTTIDYPGAKSTGVYGINDRGQIVGGFCPHSAVCAGSTVLNPTTHAFLDDHGTFKQLDYPGNTVTQANAINNAGQIVGTYATAQGLHSFLYQNGVYTNIDDPNAVWTNATAINNHGVAGGYYQDGQLNTHGFLYQNGKFATIDHPNASSTSLDGINDNGILVGVWFSRNGLLYNFKGVPIH
jgi:probable HAF family extracellular repeat protein